MISSSFVDFAWSVVAALLTSLAVSVGVVPALYRWRGGKGVRARSSRQLEAITMKVLIRVFRSPVRYGAFLCLLLAAAIAAGAMLPVNVLPASKSGQIAIQAEMPEGATLAEMDTQIRSLEKAIAAVPGIQSYSSVIGASDAPQYDDVFDIDGAWVQEGNIAILSVNLKPGADPESTVLKLKQAVKTVPGNAVYTVTNQNISGDDSQLKIELTGADAATLRQTAQLVRSKLQLVPGLSVAGTTNSKEAQSGFQIVLNRSAIEQAGADPGDILARMRGYFAPVSSMELPISPTERIPVHLKTDLFNGSADPSSRSAAQAADMRLLSRLSAESFEGQDGAMHRLDQLASVEPVTRGIVLRNREGHPFDVVTANITSRDIEHVTGQVEDDLKQLPFPQGIRYSVGGVSAQVNEMLQGISLALAVAILLVLLIVSFFFRGWRAPLAILICIPFSYIGGIAGMALFGKEWDLAAMIGFLMLSGIVVTNGIVLADKIERNLAAGMPKEEAILRGAATRVRPVLMTAVTTILTLVPLCLSGSHGTVVSQTLGLVVISGMMTSTFISLAFIPLIYHLLLDKLPFQRWKSADAIDLL
jgi:multidrug efflux pump subunit AcrB